MSRFLGKSLQRAMVEDPRIDLTPLIDVVFVILIMFIVVAPLLELDRVELSDGPQKGTVSVKGDSPVSIHVFHNNQVQLNGKVIAVENLLPQLEGLKMRYPQVRPQLFHDKRAQFGTYQSVKNAVESAGFEQMDVVLKPGETVAKCGWDNQACHWA